MSRPRFEKMKIMGSTFEIENVPYEEVKPMPKKPVISLTCCCCSNEARGRQWWNRDKGYGLCKDCANRISTRESAEEMKSNYGERGYNYDVQES